jgi:alkylation response protein AidB-like acyl-CoA dehydrogenase
MITVMPVNGRSESQHCGLGEQWAVETSLADIQSDCGKLVEAMQPCLSATALSAHAREVLADTKLIGVMIPRALGGLGLDCLSRLHSVVEATRLSPEIGAFLQIAQLGNATLLDFGNEAQRRNWLPRLASGERICTLCITEEESGSNLAGCTTRYRRTGSGFVLNGEKWMIGNAPVADAHVVLARDEDSANLSMFLVDSTAGGVDNDRAHASRGLRGFPFGGVKLTEAAVPLENLIGQPGQGQQLAHQVIGRHGRLSLTGLALGIHQRIFDVVCDFASQRRLYGNPLSELPDVRTRIFQIFSNLEQARSVALRAADEERRSGRSGVLLALAKHVNSDLACKSALLGMEVFGGRANLEEFEIGQLLLDATMTLAPSGTPDILKKRIVEDVLGERPIRWAAT